MSFVTTSRKNIFTKGRNFSMEEMPLHHCSQQVLKKRFFLLDWRKMCLYSLWPIKLNSKVMLLVCCCCFGEALNWSFQRLVESAALALLSGVNYFLWKKRALTRELQVEELIPDGSELNVCPVFQEKKVKYRLLLRRAMLDQRQLN